MHLLTTSRDKPIDIDHPEILVEDSPVIRADVSR
jgi:hypothetical protein